MDICCINRKTLTYSNHIILFQIFILKKSCYFKVSRFPYLLIITTRPSKFSNKYVAVLLYYNLYKGQHLSLLLCCYLNKLLESPYQKNLAIIFHIVIILPIALYCIFCSSILKKQSHYITKCSSNTPKARLDSKRYRIRLLRCLQRQTWFEKIKKSSYLSPWMEVGNYLNLFPCFDLSIF